VVRHPSRCASPTLLLPSSGTWVHLIHYCLADVYLRLGWVIHRVLPHERLLHSLLTLHGLVIVYGTPTSLAAFGTMSRATASRVKLHSQLIDEVVSETKTPPTLPHAATWHRPRWPSYLTGNHASVGKLMRAPADYVRGVMLACVCAFEDIQSAKGKMHTALVPLTCLY
jgi:hypothetical protein